MTLETALVMFSAGACVDRRCGIGGIRTGLVAVRRCRVVDVAVAAAVAVDLGLRHGVRRRVGPGLADVQHRRRVAVAADAGRRRVVAFGSVTTTPVSVVLPVFCTVIV